MLIKWWRWGGRCQDITHYTHVGTWRDLTSDELIYRAVTFNILKASFDVEGTGTFLTNLGKWQKTTSATTELGIIQPHLTTGVSPYVISNPHRDREMVVR